MGNIILGSDGITIRQGIYQEKASPMTDLGRFIDFQDGRRFRYCQADGEVLRGHMAAAGAVVDNDNTVTQADMTVVLSNGYIGETEVSVLLLGDTTKNMYADGLLTIEGGLGLGYAYRIKKNSAGGEPYTAPCVLTLYDPIVVALDVTSIITLTKLKYKDVVEVPKGAEVATPIGVPLIDVTDNYYFWAQTRGYAPLVVDTGDTLTIGQLVGVGSSVDGACDDITVVTQKPYGVCVQIAATATYATIDLQLE